MYVSDMTVQHDDSNNVGIPLVMRPMQKYTDK